MPTPQEIAQALAEVSDRTSLLQRLLAQTLEWPIEDHVQKIDDIAYGWTQDDLRGQGLETHLPDGQAWQFQPFRSEQPWGIFLLEFKRADLFGTKGTMTGATGVLRKVLRSAKGPWEEAAVECRAGESAEGRTRPQRNATASAGGGGPATGAPCRRPGECGLRADGGGSRADVADGAAADAGGAAGRRTWLIASSRCIGSRICIPSDDRIETWEQDA